MTLPASDWVHLAAGLSVGTSRRVDHFCGSGRTLLLSREAGGFRAWCFRCSEGGFAPPQQESLKDRLDRLAARARAEAALSVSLPEPRVAWADWPGPARLWVLRAGLGGPEVAKLGAYYHPPTNRVVLPLPNGYWQARCLDGHGPKYLGPPVGRRGCVPVYGTSGPAVVTEDVLSAFKAGLSGVTGVCALGTRLSAAFLSRIMVAPQPVLVWLDPDAAGRAGASKIIKQLSAFGIETRDVVSERDPKLHHRSEIHAICQASIAG